MSGREYMHMGKRECEEAGKVWVEAHMRSMTYVHGYCRDRTKEEIERMSSERRDLRNKKSEFEGYYEGKADEPLEAINDILRQLNYYDRSDIEFSTPEGKAISSEEFYKHGGDFTVVVTGYQHEYMVSGNVHKKNGKWIAGAESEEVDF